MLTRNEDADQQEMTSQYILVYLGMLIEYQLALNSPI